MEHLTTLQKGAFTLKGVLVTCDAGNYSKTTSPLAADSPNADAREDDEVWLLREVQRFLRSLLPSNRGDFTASEADAMRQSVRDFTSDIVGDPRQFGADDVPDEIMAILGKMRADAVAGREVDFDRYSQLCTSGAFWAFVRSRMREHFPEIDDDRPSAERVRQALGISREEWDRNYRDE